MEKFSPGSANRLRDLPVPDGRPKSASRSFFFSYLANHITVLRILLVPAFIGCLLYYSPEREFLSAAATVLFLTACLTDALDGYVARRFNQKTDFGSYVDPIADKLLLTSGFLSLSLMDNLPVSMKIPAWVTISVISRDVIILIGSTLIFLSTGTLKATPLFIGKITTVVQMGTLCAMLLSAPVWLDQALLVLTVILTIFSGILYIRMGENIFQKGDDR